MNISRDVIYIKGEDNIISRPALSVTIDSCDLPDIIAQHKENEEISKYEENLKS